jgi:sulfonate transport system substrate-binding protein
MPHTRRRLPALAVPALLLTSLIASCGDDSQDAVAGTATGDGAAIPEGTVLRVADQGNQLRTLLSEAGELDGAPYEIRFSDFFGGPFVNEAIAAGEVDVGTMGDTPAINALAGGLDTVVVAVSVNDGPGAGIYASPDSGIESIEDLNGRDVAYTSGTNTQGFVLRALDSVGLSEPDVHQVDVPLTDLPVVLSRGDAEAGVVYEFARHDFLAGTPDAVELVSFGDLVPVYSFLLATRSAVDDPAVAAALEDFVARFGRAQLWAAENRDSWIETYYVDNLGQSPEAARSVAEATGIARLVPVTDDVRDDQQAQADLLLAAGELPHEVDLADQFDPAVTERFNAVVERLADSSGGQTTDPSEDDDNQDQEEPS